MVSYVLSSQPLEPSRFIWFCAASLTVGLVAESYGVIVGSIFSVTVRYISLVYQFLLGLPLKCIEYWLEFCYITCTIIFCLMMIMMLLMMIITGGGGGEEEDDDDSWRRRR